MIIDNDPAAALVTCCGLQTLLGPKVAVSIAPSVEHAALNCAQGSVDMLIVDARPQSPAAALVKALHSEQPLLPVMVLTAYDTPLLRKQMHALGVRHYLAKPVELQALAAVVNMALGADAGIPVESLA